MARRPRWIIGMVIGALALAGMACNLTEPQDSTGGEAVPASDAPVVDIRVPVNGMSFAEGTNVIVQVVATDSGSGVSRIDLLVDDLPLTSNAAPATAGQSAFITNFEWQAQGQGLHSLTAIAFRQNETASAPAVISVNVVAAVATEPPTATPIPTQPAEAPTDANDAQPTEAPTEVPTEDTRPRGTTTIGLNVRSGPTTFHPILGAIPNGTEVDLLARNADSTWFVVPFGLSEGWVSGFYLNITGDVNSLDVQTAPPPPATPLPTAIPATAAPAATAVPAGPSVDFRSTVGDGQTYPSGTCFTFFWTASGVSAVYFDGHGVNGEGSEQVCPTASRSYTLRVTFPDGSVHEYTIPVGIN